MFAAICELTFKDKKKLKNKFLEHQIFNRLRYGISFLFNIRLSHNLALDKSLHGAVCI